MIKTILLIVGISSWLFILVTSSIKLINTHLDKSIDKKFKELKSLR